MALSHKKKTLASLLTPESSAVSGKPFVGKKRTKKERIAEGEKLVSSLKEAGELVPVSSIESRRDQLWRLYLLGVPNEVIGQTLNISTRSVFYELKKVTESLSENLLDIGALGVVARSYYRYEHLKAETSMLYTGLGTDAPLRDKLAIISLLKEVEDSQLRMVMNVGAVPRPQKLAVRELETEDDDGQNFTPEHAKGVLKDVIELIRSGKDHATDSGE